jgi:hypothetical protein
VPEALSLGIKLPGREADLSPSSSAELKNAWSYIYIPQNVFMVWYSGCIFMTSLVKRRDKFIFTLPLLNQEARHEDVWGCGGIASRIPHFDIRWR